MTALAHRPNVALIVVDVQVGVVENAYARDAIVSRIAGLVKAARGAHVPVIWVQHADAELVEGSEAWQIVPELLPHASDPLIAKAYQDSFEETALESTLAFLEVGRLYVVGAQTDACIRSTLHGALVRGYDTILVSDAHTTDDRSEWGAPPGEQVIAHTNLYWTYQRAPGRIAGTVTAQDLDFSAVHEAWNKHISSSKTTIDGV